MDDDADDTDAHADRALRPAFGDPTAVEVRWPAPADVWGKSAVDALCARVRRLGVERARRVVDGGDLHIVEGGGSRPLRADETVPRKATLALWRLPPDAPADLVHPPAVLFEGDGLVVVDKPGDLAVHPSARYLHNTLTGFLRRRGTPANPCHRLDRETSGVVVCATDPAVEKRWKQAFADGRVEKEYVAVVSGVVAEAVVVDAPLALQGDRGLVRIRVVVDPAGQPARTEVTPLETRFVRSGAARALAGMTLVRCVPRTGRQHQLRVHLAHLGHPIVGDKLYQMGDVWFDAWTRRALGDDERARLPCARQCLHARSVTLDGVRFEAPLPEDLRAVFDGAGVP